MSTKYLSRSKPLAGCLFALALASQAWSQEFPGVPELDARAAAGLRSDGKRSPARIDQDPKTCLASAATFHGVNAVVLAAIGQHESGFRPNTVVRNTNGTVDRGIFGDNSIHLTDLSRYGVSAKDLHDACKSAYVAAWRLKGHVARYGNTWRAVGAYHSTTPGVLEPYANSIHAIVRSWGVLSTGEPFPGYGTKSRPGPLARGARPTTAAQAGRAQTIASMIGVDEMPSSTRQAINIKP